MKIIKFILLSILLTIQSGYIYGYDFKSGGFYYNIISNNEVEVTYNNKGDYSGEIKIPENVTYNGVEYTVSKIGDFAFSGCSGLAGSLIIPNSVISIGIFAFEHCRNLTGTLTLSSNLTKIGDSAFAGCRGLTGSLVIPNSVKEIGEYAFQVCSGFTGTLAIPNAITEIKFHAFMGCSGLTKLIIPNTVIYIREGAFNNCKALEQVISEIIKPRTINANVFYGISQNAQLFVPEGSKSLYESISAWTEHFKVIKEIGSECDFNISSSGNGYVSYIGQVIREKKSKFTIKCGSSHEMVFFPDYGYRIASVTYNDNNVTDRVYDNRYVTENIYESTTIAVSFEEIPPTTYSLNVKATGNGSITYKGITWKNDTKAFTINEGTYVTITMTPENGYRIKSVTLDGKDVTADVKNNLYTTSGINKNTTIEVEFEVIPVTTYKLNIKATGNGSAIMGGYTIRQEDKEFPVNEGTNVTIVFSPDNGNSIQSVKVNGSDITEATGSRYVIEAMTANTSVEVTFVEDVNALTVEGINYQVTSQASKNVKLMGGSIGQTLTVPATVTQNGTTWNVTEIEQNAVMNNSELAAIIWNPEVPFTATVSNPNLLLYVTAEQYAPEAIKNVVVNGVARQISLVDAASGNGFCCPQTFTAQSISYTHRYGMETGVGASKGWETIALPFDVQEITHQTKGTIVPFANWKEGDNTKPFWLYELTGSGFVEASSIQAYKPYIISMPNNPKYNEEWQLNGEVTFKASSVTIGKSDDLAATSFQDRTFIPNLTDKPANEGFFALNVINDYSSNNSGMPEGSRFVLNMRQIHPFEAYMSTTSKSRHAIGIFDDMTTDIKKIKLKEEEEESLLFDLQGRKTYVPRKGVYIKNGKKYIKK